VTGANGAQPPRITAKITDADYCLLCLQAYKAGQITKPELAITSSPVLVPVPGGAIPVPVPACYDHALGGSKQGPSLYVAAGGLS
jgi:hypothetical protein